MFNYVTLFIYALGVPVILAFVIGRWVAHTTWMILLWLMVSWWWLIFLFGAGNPPTNAKQLLDWVLGCLVSAALTAIPLAIGRWRRIRSR